MFKGISKRWLINTFGVVLAIIILLIITLSVSVHSLCYSTVESALLSQCEDLRNIFDNYTAENTDSFMGAAAVYASNFEHKDEMEIEVIDIRGMAVTASSGFTSGEKPVPEFADALKSDNGLGKYVGRSESVKGSCANSH